MGARWWLSSGRRVVASLVRLYLCTAHGWPKLIHPWVACRCRRVLEPILGGRYLQLSARWEMGVEGSGKAYEEMALIGVGDGGDVEFWSYRSDGKRSQGVIADVTDLHPEAVGFEADMPAGRADGLLARRGGWGSLGRRVEDEEGVESVRGSYLSGGGRVTRYCRGPGIVETSSRRL